VPIAQQAQKKALEAAIQVLEQRLKANRADLVRYVSEQRQEVNNASSRVSSVESRADSRSRSFKFHGGFGCLIAIGVAAMIVGGLVYNSQVQAALGQTERAVILLKWGAGIVAFGLLLPLMIKLLSATFPAAAIRTKVPKLKRELDRTRSEAEANIGNETARMDSALSRLNQQKQTCQNLLKAL
jgi:hypothetical protein